MPLFVSIKTFFYPSIKIIDEKAKNLNLFSEKFLKMGANYFLNILSYHCNKLTTLDNWTKFQGISKLFYSLFYIVIEIGLSSRVYSRRVAKAKIIFNTVSYNRLTYSNVKY